jgi:chromosome segregation ATPase
MPDYPESRFVIKNDGTGNVIDVTQFDIAAKASAITVTNTALKATNADLQGQLTLASKSYSELQGQGVLLKSEIQELKSQNTILQTSVTEFKSSLEVAASLKKSVDSNVIALSAKIKKICATKPKPKGC